MSFWKLAYSRGWVTLDQLKTVVKTDDNPNGELTKAQYKEITGKIFR